MTSKPRFDRYHEEDVRAILKRAAELQGKEGQLHESSTMSLAEVEQAAQEAGLDVALVRRAAAELEQEPPGSRYSPWLGGPTSIALEASLSGEVPESAYEVLVAEMRRRLGAVGTVHQLGRTFAWTLTPGHNASARTIHLTVVPGDGRTVVHLEENLRHLAGGLFGGLVGGLGGGGSGIAVSVGILVSHSPLVIPLALGAWLGGVYMLTRRIYANRTGLRERELRDLLARIVAICEQAVAASAPASLAHESGAY